MMTTNLKHTVHMTTLATLFCVSVLSVNMPANAADNSKNIKLSEELIERIYEKNKKSCEQKKDFAQELCDEKVDGERTVALARLKAKTDPTLENRVDYRIAMAETKHTLSVKKCQISADKDACTLKAQVLRDKETEDARAVRH